VKAAYINQTGPANVILYGELPDPKPNPGQYLVKVSAVDVNPIDIYIRSGAIPAQLTFPYILGRDLAGTVVEGAQGTTKFKPGDRVWATGQGVGDRQGTFAQLVAVDESWLHPTPSEASDDEIVALSLVAVTAHLGLVTHAKLRADEILFVNGGTGGVGSSVVQMAKLIGARVITTAGTNEKVDRCRQLGADLALNYKTEDVVGAIRAFAPKGVNVWWETLREPDFERTIPLMGMRGRVVVMAGRDARPVFPVGPFYVKDCSLYGFAMFNSTAAEQQAAAEDINRWVAAGKLKAQIDRVLPLSRAAEAHRLQEESTIGRNGALTGKIVLRAEA
jgi:NADPH2:quinone reductase